MANGHHRIREVEEHEPSDHRIERFVATPGDDVAFHERDVSLSSRLDTLPRDGKRLSGSIHSHDRSRRADQTTGQSCHVAKSRAEVEHAQAR
jgi:hypothetical protein